MKCGIVTVYNSENCGSFLQAFALTKVIESMGYDPVCVKHSFGDRSSTNARYITNLAKLFLRGKYNGIKMLRGKRKAFRSAIENLRIEKNNDSFDCYILGSDTIWDLKSEFFNNHRSFFWGMDFGLKKIISYAASLGYADSNVIKNCEMVPKALERMAHISVREATGKKILKYYTDKEIQVVCDPTLLLTKETYEMLVSKTEYEDCIFMYYFGKMPKEYTDIIKRIAKNENLKTIIMGSGNEWCDISLPYDPLLLLGIMKSAKYVITNTFHGTAFSHIMEKRFAVADCGKVKVTDFLVRHGTLDKYFNNADDIEGILMSEFRYDAIREVMQEERECGFRFLKTAIEE